MSPAELQWLSSHLGHDVATHKKNYRLHGTAVEIAKVGRMLMHIDDHHAKSLSHKGTVELILDQNIVSYGNFAVTKVTFCTCKCLLKCCI